MIGSRSASIVLVVALVCAGFALKALWLIDATALWSDELYSVGKSFQASPAALLAMLRHDTHPPLYYAVLWGWGQLVGANPDHPAVALMARLRRGWGCDGLPGKGFGWAQASGLDRPIGGADGVL